MPEPVVYSNLRDIVLRAAKLYPNTKFFITNDKDFPFVTGDELKAYCGHSGHLMRNAEGSHIAILGANGAAWITTFFSVISSGCVAVPLHLGSTDAELEYCLKKSDSTTLLYDKSCEASAALLAEKISGLKVIELHEFLQTLREAEEEYFPPLPSDAAAALYFTSGTTSLSRCVILTHRNMGSHCTAAMSALPLSPEDAGLSILPPSHTFELMTNIVGALHCGGTLYINESIRTIKRNLQKYSPTIIVAVPLVLQTLRKEILNTAKKQGKLDKLQTGLKISACLQKIGINISHRLFKEVYSVLGGKLRYFLCGGAALDKELIQFYKALGITVLQGYGITECTPIVAANLPGANRPGSIGKTFPCCETAIIDGEICVRGDSVSPGYYNDEEANALSYRDGWFCTGDLGRTDKDGFIYFTGRKKNLIVLANGENVSPEELEERLYQIDGIIDAVVYEKNETITAEIYADKDEFPDTAALWSAVDVVNRSLAVHKHIGNIIMRDNAFEKTVTQKIKRYKYSLSEV